MTYSHFAVTLATVLLAAGAAAQNAKPAAAQPG